RGAKRDVTCVHAEEVEVHTPFAAKPTISAFPSPVRSASWRGKVLSLFQPPALAPKAGSWNIGDAKCPPVVARDTEIPSAPKPTMSARPSALTSASVRG